MKESYAFEIFLHLSTSDQAECRRACEDIKVESPGWVRNQVVVLIWSSQGKMHSFNP